MSSEAWALVGVVIGAILGGVVQVVADSLRRRHERSAARRVERREAYAEFLGAVTAALAPLYAARPVLAKIHEGFRPPAEQIASMDGVLQSSDDALRQMTIASGRVELLSPDDTHVAAGLVVARVMQFMFEDEEGQVDDLVKAQQEFARLAKRDLQ